MKIAALYVQTNGIYFNKPEIDPWDEKRDARLYAGPFPVIAHPPCNRWCQLAYLNQKLHGHKVGDDGGCFEAALVAVRRYGGVLEHPSRSLAWKHFNLPKPQLGCWVQHNNEWVTEVCQGAYGHKALKKTWLLVVSNQKPPDLDWSVPIVFGQISRFTHKGKSKLTPLSKKEASATPAFFLDLLIRLVHSVTRARQPVLADRLGEPEQASEAASPLGSKPEPA